MQAAGVCKGHPCLPAACFPYRHAHSSKLRTSLLYRTASMSLRYDKLKSQPPHGLVQVSSAMEEDTQQNDAGTKMVKVKFVLQRRCEFGQQFCVTGDEQLFGAWDPEAAIRLQWAEGHIWTVELDLSVGTCMEFKVIRMAEQEVLEWQPGPNCKLDLSEASSSLVVFVPWSDEENNLKKDPEVDLVINEGLRTEDGDETASSIGILPDLVEDMQSETHSSKSVDVTEEQTIEEKSTNSDMVKANAKDILDECHTEAKDIVTGDQFPIDVKTNLDPGLKHSEVTSPFAIPESWYGEEPEQTNEPLRSHDWMESSPVSLEGISKGETMSSDFNFSIVDKEEENGKRLVSLNKQDEVKFEGRQVSSMIVTEEFEPITKDEKDEELRLGDVPVEAASQRNVGTLLSDTELENANEERSETHVAQNVSVEEITESRSEVIISTTVSKNQDPIDMEVQVDNDPSVPISEVPDIESRTLASDSLENVESKSSITEEEKKQGRKGWSKLWSALVVGRFD